GRAVGDKRRAAFGAHALRRRPFQDQSGERDIAMETAERVFDVETGGVAGGEVGEADFVFIDVAQWDDARQDRRVVFVCVEEDVAGQPAGAPRRQVERGL